MLKRILTLRIVLLSSNQICSRIVSGLNMYLNIKRYSDKQKYFQKEGESSQRQERIYRRMQVRLEATKASLETTQRSLKKALKVASVQVKYSERVVPRMICAF